MAVPSIDEDYDEFDPELASAAVRFVLISVLVLVFVRLVSLSCRTYFNPRSFYQFLISIIFVFFFFISGHSQQIQFLNSLKC
jgi:hypothetical protein